jgi:hypothetical protein
MYTWDAIFFLWPQMGRTAIKLDKNGHTPQKFQGLKNLSHNSVVIEISRFSLENKT